MNFKINLVFAALFLPSVFFAQDKKYQSLLWEISGNGLTKKSYLYGTMHVSDKVSYHLSDAFFQYLLAADIVATESDPETWYDVPNFYSTSFFKSSSAFYTNFYIKEMVKDDLYPLFVGANYTLNGLLTRTNEMNKEYQEDTYLDMFIYRTGRKFGKKSVGLEDATTSSINIMKGQAIIDNSDREENRQALKRLLKNRGQNEAMTDFYREKDLDMLDSLMTLTSTKPYIKALLYDRNIVFVESMDSLMKTGSLFAAAGAAHLPGKNGMIELLRAKGYTVTPIVGDYTEVGKSKKKEIEDLFIDPVLETRTLNDGMLSIPLFKTVIENGEDFESADLANGGFINVKRALLKDFIKKDNIRFNHETLDSLFYENIPGDILEKKFFKEKNYLVYDIKSKTKTGKDQRYCYFITPLEIITVIMGGEGEYVRKFENLVFNKLVINEYKEGSVSFTPRKGGFEVKIPAYSTILGDNPIEKEPYDIEIYGYDQASDINYFLIENTLGESNDLVDSEFELKRIHYEFCNQFDADTSNTIYDSISERFFSESKVGDKTIRLMSTMKGAKYFLMGTINAAADRSSEYFSSFAFTPFQVQAKTFIYTDSIAMFSIEIPEKLNEFLKYRFERQYIDEDRDVNYFTDKSRRFSFNDPSGQKVQLSFYQYHKYGSEKHVDSIFADFKRFVGKEFEKEAAESHVEQYMYDEFGNLIDTEKAKHLSYAESQWDTELGIAKIDKKNLIELVDEKITYNEVDKTHIIDVVATRPNSRQAIKYRGYVKDGATYLLKTLVPKGYKNDDKFIEQTFSTFKIKDTILSPSIYESKLKYFIQDASSLEDSIRYSALKSIEYLDLEKEDLPQLKNFLAEFEFALEEYDAKLELYRKIGMIKDPSVVSYLEAIYKDENVNASTQFAVLTALSYQESKQAYQTIMKLLEYDLPLSDNNYEISHMFRAFSFDLEFSHVLFPDIFQFYGVKEYASPIMQFTNEVLKSKDANPKKLKQYKKTILTNAKLEYKRVLSWKQNQEISEAQEDFYRGGSDYAPTNTLINYLNLLYGFRKEKEVAKLFAKVEQLEIDAFTINDLEMQLAKNNAIDDEKMEVLLSKPETKFVGLQLLKHTHKDNQLNDFQSDTIAYVALVHFNELKDETDSVIFLQKRILSQNGKDVHYFFYKIIDIGEDSYQKFSERAACVAFVADDGKLNPQAYKTFRTMQFLEEKEIDEYIKSTIDQAMNQFRPRVTCRKMKERNFGYDDIFFEEEYYDDGGYDEEYYEEY